MKKSRGNESTGVKRELPVQVPLSQTGKNVIFSFLSYKIREWEDVTGSTRCVWRVEAGTITGERG
jgi:hypothetical protein